VVLPILLVAMARARHPRVPSSPHSRSNSASPRESSIEADEALRSAYSTFGVQRHSVRRVGETDAGCQVSARLNRDGNLEVSRDVCMSPTTIEEPMSLLAVITWK